MLLVFTLAAISIGISFKSSASWSLAVKIGGDSPESVVFLYSKCKPGRRMAVGGSP